MSRLSPGSLPLPSFAEALHDFLTSEGVGLRCINLPIGHEEVLDVEFADDTRLYLNGKISNLHKARGIEHVL